MTFLLFLCDVNQVLHLVCVVLKCIVVGFVPVRSRTATVVVECFDVIIVDKCADVWVLHGIVVGCVLFATAWILLPIVIIDAECLSKLKRVSS